MLPVAHSRPRRLSSTRNRNAAANDASVRQRLFGAVVVDQRFGAAMVSFIEDARQTQAQIVEPSDRIIEQ
jgi:hypothetical protein